jgi:hypothetical protein
MKLTEQLRELLKQTIIFLGNFSAENYELPVEEFHGAFKTSGRKMSLETLCLDSRIATN